MKQKWIALLIVVVMAALCALLLSGCASGAFNRPRFSIETDWGRFSYELPELQGLKK
jgi:hypothetical protein